MQIPDIVAALITEEDANEVKEFFAAVAVCEYRRRWLLGLAKDTNDDRAGKWCFPGGGIKPGETPEQAAVRECREETGVTCRAAGQPMKMGDKPGVAFVHCRVSSRPNLKENHEFTAIGFFDKTEMKALELYYNVKTLINRTR